MNQHIDLSDLDIDELEMRLELASGTPGDPTTTPDVTIGVGYGWSF